ncbi:MAG: histidinol dehydrogenase [Phycisphaerales bacterium]|jgi:histidinol dehydrogenase|nr:histidinol dehydrogenase [Phycisphaerales bacterium]
MNISIIRTDSPQGLADAAALRDMLRKGELTAGGGALDVRAIVRDIIDDVENGGDRAAAAMTSRLDQASITPENMRVTEEEIRAAHQAADEEFLQLVRRVAENIREYQESILITDPPALKRGGRTLGVRYSPMARAGVYVPGGQAIYPSTVLMTIVPAQVAGVEQIVIVSPPTGGDLNPMLLALAGELGITEVYRLGGAVAAAALAVGTETITPVDKIVGPGNAFVAEAKRQLFGRVGIDSVAGPSEVLIVADDTAEAKYVAADMLAQAEHYPGSAILVTPSSELADAVLVELNAQLPVLERNEEALACLEAYSGIIITADLDEACRVADDFATEHLQIITVDDQASLDKIRNAGAVFLGSNTPVPLGDYYAGPSHVLPTGGTAKFSGPLSCNDFLTAASILSYDAESLHSDADDVIDFATREGLTAHANAVRIRTQSTSQDQ